MSSINEVRQVLMNELGLSRESIRGLAAEIISQTVQRQLEQSGYLQNMVRDIVAAELRKILTRGAYGSGDPLTDLIRSAVNEEAKRIIRERVVIEITKP